MQKRNLLIIILFLFTGTIGWSAERIRQNFDFDWQFRLGDMVFLQLRAVSITGGAKP